MASLLNKHASADAPETEIVDKCPLCQSGDSKFLFWNIDRIYHLPGKFGTLACANCGLVRPVVRAEDKREIESQRTEARRKFSKRPNDGDIILCWVTKSIT